MQTEILFIHQTTPSYKLRAKEDVVHDCLGQGCCSDGVGGSGEVLHQFLIVLWILAYQEARLQMMELVPGAHLDYCSGDGGSMVGDLPSADWDVL